MLNRSSRYTQEGVGILEEGDDKGIGITDSGRELMD